MNLKYDILEFYFRFLTILFWGFLLLNWIFIPNNTVNRYILNIYLILLYINNIKYIHKNYIDFLYRFISIVTFIVSGAYFLLFSNNIKLLLTKSVINLMYFYISCKKVSISKDEEGVVGIIASILIFTFATCY